MTGKDSNNNLRTKILNDEGGGGGGGGGGEKRNLLGKYLKKNKYPYPWPKTLQKDNIQLSHITSVT